MTFICVMELQKYPMDTQLCRIEFGSCKYRLYVRNLRITLQIALASDAYTTADIIYVWHRQPLVISEAASVLSNFIIESFTNGTCTSTTATGKRHSQLTKSMRRLLVLQVNTVASK